MVQWRETGTFTGGPFLGVNPSGKRVELQGVDVFRFDADGKVDTNTCTTTAPSSPPRSGCSRRVTPALDRGVLTVFNTATRVRQRITASRSKA